MKKHKMSRAHILTRENYYKRFAIQASQTSKIDEQTFLCYSSTQIIPKKEIENYLVQSFPHFFNKETPIPLSLIPPHFYGYQKSRKVDWPKDLECRDTKERGMTEGKKI